MRNTKVAGQRIPTTKKRLHADPAQSYPAQPQLTYAPAVPISIYRELSTELEATKVTMDSLKTHNQQLLEQNQLLKQELERIANRTQRAVKHLENLQEQKPKPPIAQQPASARRRQPEIAPDVLVEDYIEELPIVPEQFYRAIPDEMAAMQPVDLGGFSLPSFAKPKLVYEQAVRRPLANLSDASGDMPAWKLSAVVALIICSAFGAGFLIVRPLLTSK